MQPKANSKVSHLRYIDTLRGIAFLGVFAVHAGQHAHFEAKGLVPAGRYGVQLFFLISTVTLLRSLSTRTGAEHSPTRNFYLRRLFRIAPLFWFGILLYYVLNGPGESYWAPHGLHAWHYVVTFLFVQGWHPTSINSVVPGGWSVATEMSFYLILPFLWHRVQSMSRAALCVIGSLMLNYVLSTWVQTRLLRSMPENQAYLVHEFLYFWFPAQVCVFFLGFILYRLLLSERLLSHIRTGQNAKVLILISVYGFVALTRINSPLMLPSQLLFSMSLIPLILALAAHQTKMIVNPFTIAIGRLSFGCYILHFAVLEFVTRGVLHFGLGGHRPAARFVVISILGMGATMAVAQLAFWLIEQPGIRLGNKIIRFMEARTSARSPEAVGAPSGK